MVTRVVTLVRRTYGKMGVSVGTEERMKMLFFKHEPPRRRLASRERQENQRHQDQGRKQGVYA